MHLSSCITLLIGEGGGPADKGEPGAAGDMQLDEEKLFGEISSSEDEADINIDEESDNEQVRYTGITSPNFLILNR